MGKTNLPLTWFKKADLPFEQKILGYFCFFIGLGWLIIWFYFLITNWESFLAKKEFIGPHVALQFATGLSLFISGISILRDWAKWNLLYILSAILLVTSTSFSFVNYGPVGHGTPEAMYLFAILGFFVVGVMGYALFLIRRFSYRNSSKRGPL